jgi:hypothetical protein
MAGLNGSAAKVLALSTGTGGSTDYLDLRSPSTFAMAIVLNNGTSTGEAKLQGQVSASTLWYDISAATAVTTGAAAQLFVSTVASVFDNLRINVTANAATGSDGFDAWVTAI